MPLDTPGSSGRINAHAGLAKTLGLSVFLFLLSTSVACNVAGARESAAAVPQPDEIKAPEYQNLVAERSSLATKLTVIHEDEASLVERLEKTLAMQAQLIEAVPYKPLAGKCRTSLPDIPACPINASAVPGLSRTIEIVLEPASPGPSQADSEPTDTLFFEMLCGNRYLARTKANGQEVYLTKAEANELLLLELRLRDMRLQESEYRQELADKRAQIDRLNNEIGQLQTSLAQFQTANPIN